mgnify:CR=1 FL=1
MCRLAAACMPRAAAFIVIVPLRLGVLLRPRVVVGFVEFGQHRVSRRYVESLAVFAVSRTRFRRWRAQHLGDTQVTAWAHTFLDAARVRVGASSRRSI